MRWDGTILQTTAPVVLDVGAAGKGYLVDIISARLESFGIASYVVDGSGDLIHHGPDSLRVGMEHPADPSKVIGVVPLHNRALAASAANRRSWGNGLHHILDPGTGQPAGDVIASWAVADSALVADGIATALFFADDAALQALESEFGAGWARVSTAGSINWSTNFQGELFR
jgi:thiamine biosynthesis lipoprotein